MIYLIGGYITVVILIHVLLFLQADYMSKILLANSAISCLAIAMLLLTYYFKDNNFINVIFFYIIMSPIGFYGIFLYHKNIYQKKNSKKINNNITENNETDKTSDNSSQYVNS